MLQPHKLGATSGCDCRVVALLCRASRSALRSITVCVLPQQGGRGWGHQKRASSWSLKEGRQSCLLGAQQGKRRQQSTWGELGRKCGPRCHAAVLWLLVRPAERQCGCRRGTGWGSHIGCGCMTGQCAAAAVHCCGQQGPGLQWGHRGTVAACSATCSSGDASWLAALMGPHF